MNKRQILVAVSGGIDSVVLVDILSRGDHRLVVAHVDHGIREESSSDALFVEQLARQYGLPFVSTRLELGDGASEDSARQARYEFLYAQAEQFRAPIVTAHHRDDVIGSIAINLKRGTGWRGLAVMNRAGIERPLIGWTKSQIYDYACKQRLEWVEDITNTSDAYLRNRLRAGIVKLPEADARAIENLRRRQLQLAHDIDHEIRRCLALFGNRRHPYVQLDHSVAIELLRELVHGQTSYRPSIDQAERLLLAIKTARPGTRHDIASGAQAQFSRDSFVVDTSRKMVK